jgi:hypothetical protein
MRTLSARSIAGVMSPAALMRSVLRSTHSTSAPVEATSSAITSTSRMRGTFSITHSCSVSRHAAMIGSAPFLLPPT